ncbi:MAG: hypothetical protein MUF78_10460 [Candidatus Edwardsbacteria bacterium]|jgi:hypothetical protein|nr:hypothetical protein [Candidatus Edwardsbacteria bacterium]
MKKLLTFAMLIAIASCLALTGCSKTTSPVALDDDAAINTLLSLSGYSTSDNYGDDGTAAISYAAAKDSFPSYIKWRRRITSITRNVSISYDSANAVALATITVDYYGRLIVDNNNDGDLADTLVRPLHDRGVRYVRLRKVGERWRVWGCSPLEIATVAPQNAVSIDSVRVTGVYDGQNREWLFNGSAFNQIRLRENMPLLDENSSVTLTVWGRLSDPADSMWAFLHRRVPQIGGLLYHLREPLFRTSTFVFTKTWTIASDNITFRPALRHACIDAILGSTLYDTTAAAEYSARLWTMPYIIKAAADTLP